MSSTDDLNYLSAEMVGIEETAAAPGATSGSGETSDTPVADAGSSGTSEQDQLIQTIAAALSVTTDQADYAPGSTAFFTAEGVTQGGTATFQVTDWASDPGDDGVVNDYTFQATDGGAGDLDGAADGSITAAWQVPGDGSATNATLDLVVTDETSGATAATTFTDAGESIAINAITGDNIVGAVEANAGFTISGTGTKINGETVTVKIFSGATEIWTNTATVNATSGNNGEWSVAVPSTFSAGLADGSYSATVDTISIAGSPDKTQLFTVNDAQVVDVTTQNDSDTANGAVFTNVTSAVSAGTGNYDSFLRIQDNGVEEGFNTDASPSPLDTKDAFTSALLLSSIPKVVGDGTHGTTDGTVYREFRLDINQDGAANQPQTISLDQLKIYQKSTGDLSSLSGTPLFDLDGNGDIAVLLNAQWNAGSGKGDYVVLIPDALFNNAPNAPQYVYLYSQFGAEGGQYAANSGFEEWGVVANSNGGGGGTEPPPDITIDKSGPATIDEGGDTATYTFTITASAANAATDPLTIDSIIDDKFGDLLPAALEEYQVTHPGATAIILNSGDHLTFSFVSPVIVLDADETHTNIATVTAHDNENVSVNDDDSHVVTAVDVDPAIKVVKTANVASIDEGTPTDITYTYEVTNESAASTDPLTIDSIIDDKLGPLTYKSGDTNDNHLLDKGETWVYEAVAENVTLNAGELTNVVTVEARDDEDNDVSDTDTVTVTIEDVDPAIKVVKTVDANHDGLFHAVEFGQAGGSTVKYHYEVTNESSAGIYDPMHDVALRDDNGTVDNVLDDFIPTYVSGDDGDGLLEKGETWIYESTVTTSVAREGELTNNVVVSALDDEGSQATDTDTATVTAFDGPGVRTPGFWSNLGKQYWDGVAGNEKKGANFPDGELLTGQQSLILGGNHDNVLDAGELAISRADALSFLNASTKQVQDGRWMLARDAVATELNARALNPMDDDNPLTLDPQDLLDDAVSWLIGVSGGDQLLTVAELTNATKVTTSSPAWNTPTGDEGKSPSELHTLLDGYNNTGAVLGVLFANDGDK